MPLTTTRKPAVIDPADLDAAREEIARFERAAAERKKVAAAARSERAKKMEKVEKDLPDRAAELLAAYRKREDEILAAAAEDLARAQLEHEQGVHSAGRMPAPARQINPGMIDRRRRKWTAGS